MEITFNLMLFMHRLTETIAWCNHRLAHDASSASLRTVLPAPDDRILLFSEYTAERAAFMERVFTTRSQLLQAQQLALPSPEVVRQYAAGRLLVFLPDCAFANDGVAELESDGFFDYFEYPAWDTWLYAIDEPITGNGTVESPEWYPGTELINLVPAPFVDKVQSAIDFTADQAIFWLKDLEYPTPYKIALEQAGFL